MILFEFDPAGLIEAARGGSALNVEQRTAFEPVPVLLQVAGIDLIADNADADEGLVERGLNLPLPEVGLWGLVALHHVAREGRSAYALNEHGTALLFKMQGDALLVHSLRRERTVQVPYERFFAAWKDFDRRAREFLVQTFGPLDRYSWWNAGMDAWLHETLDLSGATAPWSAMHFYDRWESLFDHVDAVEP